MDNRSSVKTGSRYTAGLWQVGALGVLAASASCSTATGVQSIAKIEITPPSASLVVQHQVTLQASPMDASGQRLTGRVVYWSSEDPTIATVSSSGVVTGVSPGGVRIAASAEGRSGTATVTVSDVPVASVTIVPDTLTIMPGASGRLLATAYDASGHVLSGLSATWGSGNTGVALVDTSGTVTGVATGTTRISASIGGRTASAAVIVAVPPPVVIAGCNGGTLSETAAASIVVTGNIDNQCQATLTSTAGSIEIQGTIDNASSATLAASGDIAIDDQINGGSAVQATAGGAFSVARDVAGSAGGTGSALTVLDCTSLAIGGDVHAGAQAKLHSHGPITISGAVRDRSTVVLWWAPSFVVTRGVERGAQVVKENWGGFPDQY